MNDQEVAKLVREQFGPTAEFRSSDYKTLLQIILVNHPLAFGGLKDVIEKQYIEKPLNEKVYRDYRITEEKIYFIYSNHTIVSPCTVCETDLVCEPAIQGHFKSDDYYLLTRKLLKY